MGKGGTSPKNERQRRAAVVIIQKYVRKWLVRHAYLKFLLVTTSIKCCWRNVLAIREFWRLKQVANEVASKPIRDLRVNLLEKRREWCSLALWNDPSKVRFEFWRKIFYCPVLFYWAQCQIHLLDWVETLPEDSRGIVLY